MKVTPPPGEKELLACITQGDQGAFTRLFDAYSPRYYDYFLKITRVHEAAEELMYDLFLNLWTVREMAVEIQNVDAFLQTIAHRRAMDFFRVASKNDRVQLAVAAEFKSGTTEGRGADHRLIDEEARQLLRDTINQLTPQRRLIFLLSKEQGWTVAQIARYLNISEGTVKNAISLSMKSMRKYLHKRQVDLIVSVAVLTALQQWSAN